MNAHLSSDDLDGLLKAYARDLPPAPCRATPELLLVKAGLAAREARRTRVRRIERWGFAAAGSFLLLGLLQAPAPLAGASLAAWIAAGLAGLAAGAFVWGLEA